MVTKDLEDLPLLLLLSSTNSVVPYFSDLRDIA